MKSDIIYNKDCVAGMKSIPDNSIDCVVTDCPYRIVSGGCTTTAAPYETTGGMLTRGKTEKRTDWVDDVRTGKLFKNNDIEFAEWLPDVYRVLKDGAHCYIMVNSRNLSSLQNEAEKVGFKFQNLLIWDKGNATPNKWYMQAYECILMLRKGSAKPINNMGTSNILRYSNIIGNKVHPTEKPIDLMRVLICNSTQEGETVLDPFMGSGTTAIACIREERHFIGYELDEKYFKVAQRRIELEQSQLSLF